MSDVRWLAPIFLDDIVTAVVKIEKARLSKSRPEMAIIEMRAEAYVDAELRVTKKSTGFFLV